MRRFFISVILFLFIQSISFAQDSEEYWSWGVEKNTPEEQQRINEENDRIRSGNSSSISNIIRNSHTYCEVTGSIDTIAQNMNGIAQMLNSIGYSFYHMIDPKQCSFEIINSQKGLYTCPINTNTGMFVYTDRIMNAEVIQIYGPADNGKPKKTAYDWAYVASTYACKDMKMPEIDDMFLQAWNSGYYANNEIEFICGMDPYLDNTWIYLIANK